MKELGIRQSTEIKIPLRDELISIWEVVIKNPIIIHIDNAAKLASHVNFCTSIGIKSIIPATNPQISPINIFFFMVMI